MSTILLADGRIVGIGTFSSGLTTVSNGTITSNTIPFGQFKVASGGSAKSANWQSLTSGSVVYGSSNATDTGTVAWMIQN